MKFEMKLPMQYHREIAPLCALGMAALVVATVVAPVRASGPPDTRSHAPQNVQSTAAPAANPIVFVDVTPDTITTLKTAQNLITRIAFPGEAKQAICGDLFDPATNTGSFVIDHNGSDVFIKPVTAKGQTNLFVKTDATTYNFDLVVVPAPQAYRVVNINLPSYQKQIDDQKAAAARELAQEKTDLENQMEQKLADRQRELEQQEATDLANEQKKLRADADHRAADMATRRFVDGILQGFTTVSLHEHHGQSDQVDVAVDDDAYVFEGRLYVRFRMENRTEHELTYQEPRVLIQGDKDRPVTATFFTSRGDYKIPANQSAGVVAVFERPSLEKGERVILFVRGDAKDRFVMLRLIEQP
jgi:hypothetical protein